MDSFQIKKKVECFAYWLEVPDDWKIYSVFSMAQLESASGPSKDPFQWPRSHQLFSVFVDGDTDNLKFFEIDCLLNERMIKRDKGLDVEYLICWTSYGPE